MLIHIFFLHVIYVLVSDFTSLNFVLHMRLTRQNVHLECDNNNNNRFQRRNSRSFTISLKRRELSPTHMLKWPGRNRVQITCNTSSTYHGQHAELQIVGVPAPMMHNFSKWRVTVKVYAPKNLLTNFDQPVPLSLTTPLRSLQTDLPKTAPNNSIAACAKHS